MPGQGDFPLARIRGGGDAHRLPGLLVARDLQRPLPRGAPPPAWRSMATARCSCWTTAPAAGSSRRLRRRMPPPVTVERVAFIEFAASDEEAEALGAMLGALGFRAHRPAQAQSGDALDAGRHQPHRQLRSGGLRPQLRQPARRLGVRHRPCRAQCARGHAPRRGAGRSRASRRPWVPTRCRSPACARVGGSLLYFIESGTEEQVWAQEFVPLPACGAAAAGSGCAASTTSRRPCATRSS